jgi:hypothetical protein
VTGNGVLVSKMRAAFLIFAIAIITPQSVSATTWRAKTLAEVVEKSDLIVLGEVSGRDSINPLEYKIKVNKVLKGSTQSKTLVAIVTPVLEYQDGSKGIFCLSVDRRISHPQCFQSTDKLSHIITLLEILQDPGQHAQLIRKSEDVDYVYLLGSLFSGFKVICKQYPQLANAGWLDGYSEYYQFVPWGDKSKVVIEGKRHSKGKLSVSIVSQPTDSKLARYYLHNIQAIVARPINGVTGEFTLTVDAGWPERVGTMNTSEALEYLRERLASKTPAIIREALIALAKMRDLESVDRVRKLLEHPYPPVEYDAKRYLEWAEKAE